MSTPSDLKITILDSFTADMGSGDWRSLAELGDVSIYPRSTEKQAMQRASKATAVITNKVAITAELIAACPNLKYVGLLSTGTNVVDLQAARKAGIAVTNIPSYSTNSVAQMVFAHILHFASGVGPHNDAVQSGAWSNGKDFTFQLHPLHELAHKHLTIIGHGEIGRAVERIAHGFGMYTTIARLPHRPQRPGMVELNEALTEADIVSLHCPLTPETEQLVNKSFLETMKPEAWLINTGRGQLIDDQALVNHLKLYPQFRAGLDVLDQEPPSKKHKLLGHPQIVVTPHNAWATIEARARLRQMVADNLESWIHGHDMNRVE